jgi:ribosomal protein L16 Arg81 hydroxylase
VQLLDSTAPVPHLLQPIGLAAFYARYYEREPLVINRDSPGHYGDLLPLNMLDEIMTTTQLTSDDVVVVDHARNLSTEDYAQVDDRIDAIQVQRLIAEGATVSLRQLQDKVPSLARLCRSAEQQFSCVFQTNVYFTPPGAQGFSTHHDTHDVFILQLEGSKRWRTYPSAVPLPLPGQRFFWKTPPAAPSMEFTLRQGDLFYCPRGIPHDARSTDEASVHVSLGALIGTWAELLLETIADVAMRDPAFRVSLPRGYASGDVAASLLDSTLKELLARIERQARPQYILGSMAERFIAERPAILSGQRATLQAAAVLTLESRVGGRQGLIYRVTEQHHRVTLLCNARRIVLPAAAAPSLQFALDTPSFRVGELPGSLTDAGKVVLIKRLMKEGAVVAVAA